MGGPENARRGSRQHRTYWNSPELSFVFALLGAGLLATGWAGQCADPTVSITPRTPPEKRIPGSGGGHLRTDVKLVVVPVTVTDPFGKPVNSLARHSFRLLEDGVEQKIASFSSDDAPVSIGFLVDASGSMKDRIQASMESLREFFHTSVPGDEFFLVRFSDDARLVTGFVRKPQEIDTALRSIQPQGWTALLDAVCLGIHQMRYAGNGRRVLLVLSDGADNNSRYSTSEVTTMVREGDAQIYAIGLFSRARPLQQLTEETGGRMLEVRSLAELPDVVQTLSKEIRNQYVLGYSPTNKENDGKYRKVKVELVQSSAMPPLRISWRRGYYAPQD